MSNPEAQHFGLDEAVPLITEEQARQRGLDLDRRIGPNRNDDGRTHRVIGRAAHTAAFTRELLENLDNLDAKEEETDE